MDFKLAYSSVQKKARIDFPGVACLKSETPPDDLIERATKKLEYEKDHGNIDFYLLQMNKLTQIWQNIRARGKESPAVGKTLSITLGVGGKLIKELIVTPATDEASLFSLTFRANPNAINSWTPDQVLANISHQLDQQGLSGSFNQAQVKGALLRACAGEKAEKLPIGRLPADSDGKPYKLTINKSRKEILLIIYQGSVFADRTQLSHIVKLSGETVKKISTNSDEKYIFHKNDLMEDLKAGIHGSELVDVDLPMALLIGSEDYSQAKKKPKSKSSDPGKRKASKPKATKEYPGKGLLQIEVSEDKMTAEIRDFNMDWYSSSANFEVNEEWLRNELDQLDIIPQPEAALLSVVKAIVEKLDLTGMIIAKGEPGKAPAQGYLHKSYQDINMGDSENVDIRDAMGGGAVKPGDLVFEVRYKSPGVAGVDVYGEKVIPDSGKGLVVEIGPGIELREEGKYYALEEGQPKIEGPQISISQIYHHKGDINLKSGNVYFNGPANIEGNIRAGATVMVKGDLTVTGSIEAAFVRSGGSILVKEGINTTENGRVQARENLTADYIGNSNIVCGGDLYVRKAILNSQIIVGGSIEVDKRQGTLAGGKISCRGDIRVAKLGFPKGDTTVLAVGLDWRAELSLRIKQARLARINRINEENRKHLRELIRKKAGQLTAKHKEAQERLQARLQRERAIMDKLEERIAEAEKLMSWDKEVKVWVYETLCANVSAIVGGTKITIPGEVAGVALSATRMRGSNVIPIEDVKK